MTVETAIRRALTSYIEADFVEPQLLPTPDDRPSRPHRARWVAAASVAAAVGVTATVVLFLIFSTGERSRRNDSAATDLAAFGFDELTAEWIPPDYTAVYYQRWNDPDAATFTSVLAYAPNGSPDAPRLRITRRETRDGPPDAEASAAVDEQLAREWPPSWRVSSTDGDTTIEVTGPTTVLSEAEVRRVADGVRLNPNGGCIAGGTVESTGACAEGTASWPTADASESRAELDRCEIPNPTGDSSSPASVPVFDRVTQQVVVLTPDEYCEKTTAVAYSSRQLQAVGVNAVTTFEGGKWRVRYREVEHTQAGGGDAYRTTSKEVSLEEVRRRVAATALSPLNP